MLLFNIFFKTFCCDITVDNVVQLSNFSKSFLFLYEANVTKFLFDLDTLFISLKIFRRSPKLYVYIDDMAITQSNELFLNGNLVKLENFKNFLTSFLQLLIGYKWSSTPTHLIPGINFLRSCIRKPFLQPISNTFDLEFNLFF